MKKIGKLKFVCCTLVLMIMALSTTGAMAMNNKLWFQKLDTTDIYISYYSGRTPGRME